MGFTRPVVEIFGARQGMEGERGVTIETLVWSYLKVTYFKKENLKEPQLQIALIFLNTLVTSCTMLLIQLDPLLTHITTSWNTSDKQQQTWYICAFLLKDSRGKHMKAFSLQDKRKKQGRWRIKLKVTIKHYLASLVPRSHGLSPACLWDTDMVTGCSWWDPPAHSSGQAEEERERSLPTFKRQKTSH